MPHESDYRALLRHELESRCERNPRYSLRSFARDLGVTSSRLSEVLRGRYGLSRDSATQMAKRLGWSNQEIDHFGDLVDLQHARSRQKKLAAQGRLSAYNPQYRLLTADSFRVIADWYHYAILELTTLVGFKSDTKWIARRLGISLHLARGAIARLKRLGLLVDEKGNFRAAEGFTASPSGVPSDALKKFHRQLLEKAVSALYLQSVEERDFAHMVLAIDRARLPEAKEELKRFRRHFDAKFGASPSRNDVYCLGLTFFSLQEKTHEA
jgi:uncharacterized protein (TIGR02147 family)